MHTHIHTHTHAYIVHAHQPNLSADECMAYLIKHDFDVEKAVQTYYDESDNAS